MSRVKTMGCISGAQQTSQHFFRGLVLEAATKRVVFWLRHTSPQKGVSTTEKEAPCPDPIHIPPCTLKGPSLQGSGYGRFLARLHAPAWSSTASFILNFQNCLLIPWVQVHTHDGLTPEHVPRPLQGTLKMHAQSLNLARPKHLSLPKHNCKRLRSAEERRPLSYTRVQICRPPRGARPLASLRRGNLCSVSSRTQQRVTQAAGACVLGATGLRCSDLGQHTALRRESSRYGPCRARHPAGRTEMSTGLSSRAACGPGRVAQEGPERQDLMGQVFGRFSESAKIQHTPQSFCPWPCHRRASGVSSCLDPSPPFPSPSAQVGFCPGSRPARLPGDLAGLCLLRRLYTLANTDQSPWKLRKHHLPPFSLPSPQFSSPPQI